VKRFKERLFEGPLSQEYTQSFEISRVVFEKKTDFQDLIIFETPAFGRVLALDGIVQVTEKDEFAYHEMLVHVPLFAHGNAARVLIIGGGDGGVLREVLRHDVESATLVELDKSVIDICRRHLPMISNGAFDDPRCHLVVANGCAFAAETDRTFDIIIVDSTDPVGPGEALFSEAFYGDCQKRLAAGGVIVTQNGVPFFQPLEVTNTYRRLKSLFADVGFYVTAVPTYVGGLMALGWASNDESLRMLPVDVLCQRFAAAGFETGYYTPQVHLGAFALPPFVTALMQ
jgi:spermidine synthase